MISCLAPAELDEVKRVIGVAAERLYEAATILSELVHEPERNDEDVQKAFFAMTQFDSLLFVAVHRYLRGI